VLAAHFRAAAERGEVAGSLPPHVLAALFLGTLFAAALPRRDVPGESLRVVLGAAVKCFLRGARGGEEASSALPVAPTGDAPTPEPAAATEERVAGQLHALSAEGQVDAATELA
jgi:hypothetical protein